MRADEAADPGILYVVATPVGNLEDITRRAVRILGEVSLVAAEDTRHTRKLLSSLNIRNNLLSYYKGKELARSQKIVEKLCAGEDVALVSDAGTPAVSDPGALLVRHAIAAGIRVVPVPGPSALTAAISVAGLEDQSFLFLGFLPGKKGERVKLLNSLSAQDRAIVFYESPHRIIKSLADCLEIMGDRSVFLGRELTKIHEELFHSTLSEVLADLSSRPKVRGEFVVMVRAGEKVDDKPVGEDLDEILAWYRDSSGMSMRDACRKIATDLGISRSEIYNRALELWQKK